MGLTTEYDRHVVEGIPFGVIGSFSSRICTFVFNGFLYCAAPTCEYVTVWNVRKNQRAVMLKAADLSESVAATCVIVLDDADISKDRSKQTQQDLNSLVRFAVGYADGSTRLFDVANNIIERRGMNQRESQVSVVESKSTMNGHKSAVLTLAFDANRFVIASGAKDNDIVLWDALNERGLIRLKGHRAAVTKLAFISIDEPEKNFATSPTDDSKLTGEISTVSTSAGNGAVRSGAWRSTILVSCSKDTFIKFWDLDASHCFLTVAEHRSELCDFVYLPNVRCLLTGTLEQPLRVFQIVTEGQAKQNLNAEKQMDTDGRPVVGTASLNHSSLTCIELGELGRTSRNRVVTIATSHDGRLVAVHGQDRVVELFRVRDMDEQRKLRAKKLKKLRLNKRQRVQQEGDESGAGEIEPDENGASENEAVRLSLDEQFVPIGRLVCEARVVTIDFFLTDSRRRGGVASQAYGATVLLADNVLEFYAVNGGIERRAGGSSKKRMVDRSEDGLDSSDAVWRRTARIETDGHRGYVRSVAVSNDARQIATVSYDALKLWNVETQNCVRTFHFGDVFGSDDEAVTARSTGSKKAQVNALCCAFVPGDLHVAVGTESGALMLVDVNSAQLAWCARDAHAGAIWSLQIFPNKLGLVTGSSDKSVKFWNFELSERDAATNESYAVSRSGRRKGRKGVESMETDDQDGNTGAYYGSQMDESRRVTLHLSAARTLTMHDEVLAVCISADSRLLLVALLDSTVRVLFADSFSVLTTLYGHSLPVVSIDCSPDSRVCATASADHSVRIWGLDFGDCHRSFSAHSDAATCVRFGNAQHEPAVLFSSGKDGRVREWDSKKLTGVCALPDGPVGGSACWCVAVAPRGEFVVACSQDRSIRIWKRTDQLLILEEEREIEREKQLDAAFAHDTDEDRVIPGEFGSAEVGIATRQTDRTLRFVERLTDAIKVFSDANAKKTAVIAASDASSVAPQKITEAQALLVAYNARSELELVAKVLQSVRSPDLDDVLLRVSFDEALTLLEALARIAEKRSFPLQLELACRCAVFLIKLHRNQLTNMPESAGRWHSLVERLASGARDQLSELRSCVGMNRAGVQLIGNIFEQRKNEVRLFREAFTALNSRKRKRKQKEALSQAQAALQ